MIPVFPPMKLLMELCTDALKTYHIKWRLESMCVIFFENLFAVAYLIGCFALKVSRQFWQPVSEAAIGAGECCLDAGSPVYWVQNVKAPSSVVEPQLG